MADQEFPCRTKTVSQVEYSIIVRDETGKQRASISFFSSEEEAQGYIDRMPKTPNRSFEIVSRSWTEEVCIECGRESW